MKKWYGIVGERDMEILSLSLILCVILGKLVYFLSLSFIFY